MDNELYRCLSTEYRNAFGFQCDGNDNSIIIAKIATVDHDRDVDLKEIKTFLQQYAATINCFSWIGRNCVEIDYTEWEKIPVVFQALIDRGDLYVMPHSKLDCSFKKGDVFSRDEMELKKIQQFREFAKDFNGLARAAGMIRYEEVFAEYFNWHTVAGKEFCAELRLALYLPLESETKSHYSWSQFDETCKKYKVLHRGVWSAYEPLSIQQEFQGVVLWPSYNPSNQEDRNEPNAKRARIEKKDTEENENLCLICMDKRPETMVLPCCCSVVCKKCSEQLKVTNDKNTCVKCRRTINEVCE